MTINNWNAETRSFKYSDADLFLPKAETEIDIGYLPADLHRVITGHITDMQVSFPAAGQSVLTVSGLNKLDELRNEQRSQVFENMTRSEEHTSELQSLMRISYAVFCLKKKNNQIMHTNHC